MSKLEKLVKSKIASWDVEAEINATRAVMQGRTGVLVTYPSGKQMVRFAEPFKDFGMHYEVTVECWKKVVSKY